MNIDLIKPKALATAAAANQYDAVALNDYGMAVPPATVLGLIAEIERHRQVNAEGCKPDLNILLPPTVTQAEPVACRNTATAPKEGTLVLLDFYFTGHPIADADYATTAGTNGFDLTDFDSCQFAGWDWEQDRFTEGLGTPIGWLPIPTIEQSEAYQSSRNSGRRA